MAIDHGISVVPRVLVIGLGGTIAMTSATAGGVSPSLSTQQLLDAVPGLAATGIEIDALSFRSQPGASLTIEGLIELTPEIGKYLAAGVAGVVVTQGTDTIEETAYALDLLHPGAEPIVVTGAMRNPTMAGADGPANLLAAILVAASPAARGYGCLVVMADEVHAARRVRKMHSTSIATFASPDGGPVGYVIEGHPLFFNGITKRYVLPAPSLSGAVPIVGMYSATVGDDGRLLDTVARNVDGLIIAGFGAGHAPETWVPVLNEAAARIPIVLASRTGAGPVLSSTYGFPGSERDLLGRGLIASGMLHPYKARILLALALAIGADRKQITDTFACASAMPHETSWPWPSNTGNDELGS